MRHRDRCPGRSGYHFAIVFRQRCHHRHQCFEIERAGNKLCRGVDLLELALRGKVGSLYQPEMA